MAELQCFVDNLIIQLSCNGKESFLRLANLKEGVTVFHLTFQIIIDHSEHITIC